MKLINFLEAVDNPYIEQQVRVIDYSILPNNSFFELIITFFISSIILFLVLGIILIIMQFINCNKDSSMYLQINKSFNLFAKIIILFISVILVYILCDKLIYYNWLISDLEFYFLLFVSLIFNIIILHKKGTSFLLKILLLYLVLCFLFGR